MPWDWIPRLLPEDQAGKNKALRLKITVKYGYITFACTMILILLIPYWNRVAKPITWRLYRKIVRRIKILRIRNNYFTLHLEVIKTILFWTIVLGVLSALELHSDIQFLAARLGRVATYCLPTVLVLTLRPSPLPDTLYLSLLPIHKWLSRIVILQSIAHTIMYIWIFWERNTMAKIWKRDNLYGIYALICFILILVTSLPKVRRKFYNVFFAFHYICTWAAVLLLYVHVRPPIPYLTALNVAILVYQIYFKFKISRVSTIEVTQLSANLLLVTFPGSALAVKSTIPGCHLRMNEFDSSNYLKQIWRHSFMPVQHPFTIATLPFDESQKMIVRKGHFDLSSGKKYLITGAYLPHLSFLKPMKNANPRSLLFHTKVKKCLIVVGGSAISFALPILRTLSYNGATVKIIWVLRDHEDLKILDYFQNILVNDDCIDIFITGSYSQQEIYSFKRAIRELHRINRQTELSNQEQVLNGHYSPQFHEKSPLMQSKVSYQAMASEFDPAIAHESLAQKNRAGYIPLRHHAELLKSGYSAEDEDKFENVDLDLDGKCRNPEPDVPRSSSLYSGIIDTPAEFVQQRDSFSLPYSSSSGIYDDLADYWILKGLACRIEFGRPRLGIHYYNWCTGSSCIGPLIDIQNGQSVCCNEITIENRSQKLHYQKSDGHMLGSDAHDELFLNEQFMKNRQQRFQERGGELDESTWVVGAGPIGLVNKVQLWANDCGFNFHAESFSI
ncbi:hypothetical protein KL919_003204 [Ogataea angusta]|nr:hypothetical protein KL941_005145 [Ogataea angusta]KAG7859139.1 hypothetical protein KL919_003204 [Ogataea angusta]